MPLKICPEKKISFKDTFRISLISILIHSQVQETRAQDNLPSSGLCG